MRRIVVTSVFLFLTLSVVSVALADKPESASGEILSMDGRTLVLKVKKAEESFTLTSDTEYRRANEELRAGQLKEGDRVRVKYFVDEEQKVAVRVELWIPPNKLRRGGV